MTINTINSSPFVSACVSPEAQVALLVLQNQDQQQEINQQTLASARRDFIEDSQAEVAAMHEEAHDILTGAWVESAVVIGGAAMQGVAIAGESNTPAGQRPGAGFEYLRGTGGSVSNTLSSALGKALGDSPAAEDRADAKQASTAAQQDQWEIEDCKTALQKSQGQEQQATEWLSKLVDTGAADTNALLSNMA